MNRDEKIVKLKLDVIFKRMFGTEQNEKVIRCFIASLLDIPKESIRHIYISNVELAPEYFDQKFSRLDLKLDVDGKIVNIEMQVNKEPNYKVRTLFYWSKLFTEELKTGEDYEELKQTICINILNNNVFDCEEYHSHFEVLERNRIERLTDRFAIHFFELKKVKKSKNPKPVEDWLELINAETEDDLMALQQTSTIPEIQDAIVILRQMSADEKIRQEAYYREKRLHDEASAVNGAKREGFAEGEAKGKSEGKAEGKAEGNVEKAVKVVKNLLSQNFTLENALAIAEIDEETYKANL